MMLRIGLGKFFYSELTNPRDTGPSVRIKYIFPSLIKLMKSKYIINYFKVNYKININHIVASLVPLTGLLVGYGHSQSLMPLHIALVKYIYSTDCNKLDLDIVFLHYLWDALRFFNCKKIPSRIIVLEMPESPLTTFGYLSHRKIGLSLIKRQLAEYLSRATLILTPTERERIEYAEFADYSKIFVIYNTIPSKAVWEFDEKQKEDAIALFGWQRNLELILKLIRLGVPFKKFYVFNAGMTKVITNGDYTIELYDKIPRNAFLKALMRTKVAVFTDFVPWLGGHSVRLNDAALMGNVVLGTHYDLRGEPYPATYPIANVTDLVVKLRELHKEDLVSLGLANRKKALERIHKNEDTFRLIYRKIDKALGHR